jgi:hypothetical protein
MITSANTEDCDEASRENLKDPRICVEACLVHDRSTSGCAFCIASCRIPNTSNRFKNSRSRSDIFEGTWLHCPHPLQGFWSSWLRHLRFPGYCHPVPIRFQTKASHAYRLFFRTISPHFAQYSNCPMHKNMPVNSTTLFIKPGKFKNFIHGRRLLGLLPFCTWPGLSFPP